MMAGWIHDRVGEDIDIPRLAHEGKPVENSWTKESIDEICSGFQKARILLTAAELDIFTILCARSQSVAQICEDQDFSERGLTILLDALTSMGLLDKDENNVYSLADNVCALMSSNAPETFLPMALHRARMWKTWSNLTEIVKTGTSEHFLERKKRSKEDMEAFIGAMHAVGLKKSQELAQKLDLAPYRKMIDVGGASGTYIMSFMRRNSALRATLFDLPEVIAMARRRIADEGFDGRVDFIEGDYNKDSFPKGHDLALLSAVIHINSREANRSLYTRLYECLNPGSAILIRDFLMDDSRTRPHEGAIFAVNMLVATIAGNSYTLNEVMEDLVSCGFLNPHLVVDGPRMDQVVIAHKP